MSKEIAMVMEKLQESIRELSDSSAEFVKDRNRDFTRKRKISFSNLISFLLSLRGGTLSNEMMDYFGFSPDTATVSALLQQRKKLNEKALPTLFEKFVQKTDRKLLYKGYRLFAADGTDIRIPSNPNHAVSHYPGVNGQSSYNIMHLDAIYDLLQHTYHSVTLDGDRKASERRQLCRLVDKSTAENVLIIADRGYEGYNLMAHIQEKGWKYLIRIQDIERSRGIASGFDLPSEQTFDFPVDLSITKSHTNEVNLRRKDRNHFRRLSKDAEFDYLPMTISKGAPVEIYNLPFRIVRFKIKEDKYETVVTNLDKNKFPTKELKKLYAKRWGIETSFRELKYTVGLLHFHAIKVEYICQEVFARLIMYNFTRLITSSVIISHVGKKHAYQANFTDATHICRQFIFGKISPPRVEALIRKHISPIRPGRSDPRKLSVKNPVSFVYRVA